MFAAPYHAAALLTVGVAYIKSRGRNRAVSSSYPDVSIPKKSLVEFVLEHCPKFGATPAFVDGVSGRKYTFEQIPMLVKRAAAGLQAQGFKKGDCCLMLAPNLPEYPLMFLAILYAGGVVTTANPLATPEDLRKQLKDSSAKLAVTIPLFMGKLAEADSSLKVITFGDQPNSSAASFLSLIGSEPLAAPVPVDPENDVVVLPYSSVRSFALTRYRWQTLLLADLTMWPLTLLLALLLLYARLEESGTVRTPQESLHPIL